MARVNVGSAKGRSIQSHSDFATSIETFKGCGTSSRSDVCSPSNPQHPCGSSSP